MCPQPTLLLTRAARRVRRRLLRVSGDCHVRTDSHRHRRRLRSGRRIGRHDRGPPPAGPRAGDYLRRAREATRPAGTDHTRPLRPSRRTCRRRCRATRRPRQIRCSPPRERPARADRRRPARCRSGDRRGPSGADSLDRSGPDEQPVLPYPDQSRAGSRLCIEAGAGLVHPAGRSSYVRISTSG